MFGQIYEKQKIRPGTQTRQIFNIHEIFRGYHVSCGNVNVKRLIYLHILVNVKQEEGKLFLLYLTRGVQPVVRGPLINRRGVNT